MKKESETLRLLDVKLLGHQGTCSCLFQSSRSLEVSHECSSQEPGMRALGHVDLPLAEP